MMKKISLLLVSCAAALSLQADVKALAGTWQMVGMGADFNLSEDSSLTENDFSIIWYWDNGAWKAFSKDANTENSIKSIPNLWGDFIKRGSAFWIKTKRDIEFIPYLPEMESLPRTKGWHMVSSINGLYNLPLYFLNNDSPVKSFFAFRDGAWSYAYRKIDGTVVGDLKNLDKGEGGWVYLEEDIPLDSSNYTIYTPNSQNEEKFADKKLTFSNGLELTLDQNGTVLSSDTNYSGMKWSVRYSNSYSTGLEVENEKHLEFFSFHKDWPSGNEVLDKIVYVDRKILSNGVKAVENVKYDYFSNDVTISISDYTKEKSIDDVVSEIMDQINDLLTNGNTDANTLINNAKSSLYQVNDNDAKVALAVINLIEVLNEPIAQSFVIDGDLLNLNSFFEKLKTTPDSIDTINLSQSITSYSSDARTLLETLSANLESSADKLLEVSQDKNYVFAYSALNGKKLNYVDITMLRSVMYLLAYKLEYLASFELGTDEWIMPVTEGNIEYVKASADPVGFLNSKTFFVNPDQSKLDKAKNLLIKSLELYNGILESKSYDKGLLVRGGDLTTRNIRRKVYGMLQNLTGNSQYVVLMDDWVDWNWNEQTQQNESNHVFEKGILDLNAIFNSSTTVTINDFPTFQYDGIYDEAKSKEYDEPCDANGKPIGIIYDQKPTTVNNINNVILKFVTEDGTTLEGINLLNELFKD